MGPFGRTLLIANPTSQNGKGREAARQAAAMLRRAWGADSVDVELTRYGNHAQELAQQLGIDYDLIIALGGDGVIHEVVNGLMALDYDDRPALAIIPVGSGNDYAATLGMSCKFPQSVQQILDATYPQMRRADIGLVNGHCFMETLSFGLDAAIALDTMERRKRTGKTGTALYFEAGIDQLLHHLNPYAYDMRLTLDGQETRETGESYIFAVQLGPTYGGHFRVAPAASITDGIFEVVQAHGPLNTLTATVVFMMAKNGHHLGFKQIRQHRAQSLVVDFEAAPPAQMDGEPIVATHFEISTVPAALRVLFAE